MATTDPSTSAGTSTTTSQPPQDERVRIAVSHWAPRFVSNGVDLSDFNATLARIQTWSQWLTEWARTARDYERLATEAEAKGHALSAAEAWRRAALCWHFGKFVFMEDPDLALTAQQKLAEDYQKGMWALEPPAARVEIPYGGVHMAALLRRPAGAERPPVVIMLPGLDSTKEEIQTTADYLLRRGLATLAVDGPGQGETEALLHIEPAYERASQAMMDWITGRDDLDHDRVGVFGVSLGGYYSVRTAAFVPGIKAAVDLAGIYSMSEHWDERPPMTRATFTRRSGAANEAEGQERSRAMTLDGATAHVHCPLLIVHGTRDTIVPFSDAERIHAEIPSSELAAFQESNHGCTDRVFASRSLMGDWLAERLG
ncbi:MAG TPA: alpha/beta fold hydrolase [Ktedonobacterales bacterium]|nr:alpha/beta fold hydrolase [Ktedonobacterales bacterium]